jgi:hypothetical protein
VYLWVIRKQIFVKFKWCGYRATIVSNLSAPPPLYRPPPPPPYGSIAFIHFEDNSDMVKLPMLKSNEKTRMVEEPSYSM